MPRTPRPRRRRQGGDAAHDMFWGDRYGVVEDPFGHSWSMATTKKVMTEAEIKAAAQKAMSGEGAPA